MQTCKPGGGTRAVVLGALWGLGVPAALLLLIAAALGPLSAPLRLTLLGLGLLLSALLGWTAYRILYLGPPYVTYDRETIVFHFSRREQVQYTYQELKGAAAGLEATPAGYVLRLRQGQRVRPFPLYAAAPHYRELIRLLRENGILRQFGLD